MVSSREVELIKEPKSKSSVSISFIIKDSTKRGNKLNAINSDNDDGAVAKSYGYFDFSAISWLPSIFGGNVKKT